MVIYEDLMGFNGNLMGFNGNLMGFNGDLMVIYDDLWGFNGIYPLVMFSTSPWGKLTNSRLSHGFNSSVEIYQRVL